MRRMILGVFASLLAVTACGLSACAGNGVVLPSIGPRHHTASDYSIPIHGFAQMLDAYELWWHRSKPEGQSEASLNLVTRAACSLQNNAYALAGDLSDAFSTAVARDGEGWYWVVTARISTDEAEREQVERWVGFVAHTAQAHGCWISDWELLDSNTNAVFQNGRFE